MSEAVCLEPCLWIGSHLEWCKPPTSGSEASLFTWIPETSEFVYIIKVLGYTLLYVPQRDTVYFANPAYNVSNHCSSDTVFMGQFVKDPGCPPRLLVFDLLCEGGESQAGVPAATRYAKLQNLQKHFNQPNCILQWCGNREALSEDFLRGLPHKVRGILGVGNDPFAHLTSHI